MNQNFNKSNQQMHLQMMYQNDVSNDVHLFVIILSNKKKTNSNNF